jgi:hypothetical protein
VMWTPVMRALLMMSTREMQWVRLSYQDREVCLLCRLGSIILTSFRIKMMSDKHATVPHMLCSLSTAHLG